MRETEHSGTGPGDITPDGCSVELYTRLPANGEPEIIAAAVPPGATLLELGAGAGRMTRRLLELGFQVTAVDESAPMLAHIRGARTVRSTIEGLALGERFAAVTLTSFLVNTADRALRTELLRTCARHVAPGGSVIVQCEGEWHATLEPGSAWERNGMRVRLAVREPAGDAAEEGAKRVTMEYAFEDAAWSQTFLSRHLTEGQLREALEEAGLVLDAWLTDDHTWLRAVPAAPGDPA
ncbi:class I SAM-dependent methyltransferase [Streptomyces armeniacus]|uniref:Class I SAM-dependent methyltransferase n=1 Tax=Streptomyces armeniacus TaxID=83291 RepID=A0A345Y072_9ACTN|nr:class I SAM-dependent methyltransferase [Streptomyces armeniacus]